ncbi:hypothetical protein GCM10023354_01300 [Garicola koreensis]|uniref:hypothetical protein n=1 Tax=Garicola koreensis TaxID=1262554 RepID=UPI0031E702D6
MTIFFVIMQVLALLGFFMWWKGWSGKSTSWLEGRGWGWKPLFFLFAGIFFQGFVLAALVFPSAQGPAPVDSPLLRLLLMFMWLVVCPVVLFGMLFWWPRFMLPGWIRERLRAGDPVKTAHPIPEVQHLMTKPQNTRLLTSGHEQGEQVGHQPGAARRTGSSEAGSGRLPQLPVVFKVSTGGWWFGGIVGVISAVVLAAAVLGVPASVFEGTSGLMPLYRVLALVGAPLAAVAGLYLLRGAARPEHVRVAADGLSTRSWQLDWDEVERVGVTGDPASQKGRVQLVVSDSVFAREGRNNRWFSGRPLGLGGMVNNEPIIQLQPGLKTTPLHVAELIETARTARGTNYEGPGVPR